MNFKILIKQGTVVDGSGAAAYQADVRVANGRITEIGLDLKAAAGERVVDARDCLVTPGFIETHNHWDGGLWWSPLMEPAAGYGITTSINGNCGFSMAPAKTAVQDDVIDIFNFFEDIPVEPMKSLVTWDWTSWSEYKASFLRNVSLHANFAAFCGHIPLRLCVMGEEAWDRAATQDEIKQMCDLLDDAMAAGAMGLSSNQLDHDKQDRPLPSQKAEDDEYLALMKVVAQYEGATIQVVVDHFMRMTGPEQSERLVNLAHRAGVRIQWAGVPTLEFQKEIGKVSYALHERFKAEDRDAWTGYHHVSYTSVVNFKRTLVFAQNGNQVWQELVDSGDFEAKKKLLTDPAWLARARESWDNQYTHSYLHRPKELFLRESESGCGPVGVTLADYMEQSGIEHASDAMARWILDNGDESTVLKTSWERDMDMLLKLLKDPRSVGNISDAGAHGKLFCGAGHNILLLTEFVRDKKLLTIEAGVHVVTGKLADFFGLSDRGHIRVGAPADIAIFNLDEVECRPERKIWDVWDGKGGRTYRYTRDAAPMRLTLVNGVPTFDNGEVVGRFPGEFLAPGPVAEPDSKRVAQR